MSLTPSRVSQGRYAPPRLVLGSRAVTEEAKALVAHCLDTIVLPSLTDQQKRPTSLPKIARATEGLLGGLLALDGAQWARRPLSNASFTSEPGISLGQFLKALEALEGAGLVERSGGSFNRQGPVATGIETRLRLTDTGRELVASYGVQEAHFSGD
jgi:hypothetical protein